MRGASIVRCLILLLLGSLFWAGAAWSEETVCIQCHGGLDGELGAPVAAWRGSIHAENGISCHDCHGGDPTDFAMAMSPERGFVGVPEYTEVPDFCGKCHVGVKEDYLFSAHGQALAEGGANCVTCHGNHAVQRATPEIINPEDCSRCHGYGQAGEIKAAVSETDRMLTDLESQLEALAKEGIAVEEMKNATFALSNDFHRLFHSVDVDRVRSETADFQQRGAEIQAQIEAIQEELQWRLVIGGVVTGLLLLAGLICFLIRKTYQQEEQAEG